MVAETADSEAGRRDPGSRRGAREQAMFVVYQSDLTGGSVEENVLAARRDALPETLSEYVERVAGGVDDRRAEIDDLISHHTSGWPLERLGYMERSILRVAVWEILDGSVPAAVAVNEAVELAKRFCTAEAAPFVNGVLGGVTREGRI